MDKPSYAGETYTGAILDSSSAKSDLFLVKAKSAFSRILRDYKRRVETQLQQKCYRLLRLRLDQAREISSVKLRPFCRSEGIMLEYSPAFASQSNEAAERLIQEHSMRTRVFLLA